MSLPIGVRLGPYDVTGMLGAGGMGEVYRARDGRLNRDVALKILPDAFASDPERLTRFQREAQVLASLNHPHIAAIYGLEESGGVNALVLELVEGETLADRIVHGPVPLDEALSIGRQIAEALETAHEQGVVHRDLKPANIKVTPSGSVKVLDFGLAKFYGPQGPAAAFAADAALAPGETGHYARGDRVPLQRELTASPTMASPAMMTGAGMVLGTAAYMSPEQARGKAVDRRADIWAFGCVLFEMLTGKRTFDAGDTVSDAVAAILKTDPDWSALPADVPTHVRTLLRRCLQKDPEKRLPHIGLARIEIDEGGAGPTRQELPERPWRRAVPWALTGTLAIGLAVIVVLWSPWRAAPRSPEMRVEVRTPAGVDPFSMAISPDGRQVAFVASEGGQSRLWLRSLVSGTVVPLPGTDGVAYPFWSPDSRSIAFFANTRLMRWDAGGSATALTTTVAIGRGGAWNADGVILFAQGLNTGLSRIPSSGGEATAVTTLGEGQISHRFPQFLPGGRRFLFYVQGTADVAGIYIGSLESSGFARVTASDTAGLYSSVAPGWLLSVREGALEARPFDAGRGEIVGNPVTVAERVAVDPSYNIGAFSVSLDGSLVYRAGGIQRQLTWFDRSGTELGTMGAPDATYRGPELAPDGRRVAVERTVQGNADVWLYDDLRSSKFTFGPGPDDYPHWSGDGRQIAFRGGANRDFFIRSLGAGGTEAETPLLKASATQAPNDWSPDGRFLLYISINPKTSSDLWVLPMSGERKPTVFVNSRFTERNGQFSPDGRLVAYQSDESGRFEIYVRPFQAAGPQLFVSADGGVAPRWRVDGKELYYVAPDGTLMAVQVAMSGTSVEPGKPTSLFRPRILFGGSSPVGIQWQYDVSRDGRFLVNVEADDTDQEPLRLIVNWNPRQ